jgi:hypothetical protein
MDLVPERGAGDPRNLGPSSYVGTTGRGRQRARSGTEDRLRAGRTVLAAGCRRGGLAVFAFLALAGAPSGATDAQRGATSQTDDRLLGRRKSELGRLGDPTASACRTRSRSTAAGRLAAEDRDFYEHGGISPRHRPRGLEQRHRESTGRLDDHPAVREERLPDPGAHLGQAQGQGGAAGAQARDQSCRRTRSSRTTSTPSTSAAVPTASRRRAIAYFGRRRAS